VPAGQSLDYLLYHFVNSEVDDVYKKNLPGYRYAIGLERFKSELEFLLYANFTTVSLREVYNRWQTDPEYNLPSRPVIITFDGANLEWLEVIAPELAKRNMKAVFYVITGWVERHEYPYVEPIGWDGLRALSAFIGKSETKLFEIESHSVTHRLVADLDKEIEPQIRYELRQSKLELDSKLNQDTRFLALPDGKHGGNDEISKMVRSIAEEEGYIGIRTSSKEGSVFKTTSPFRHTCRYVARRDRGMGYMRFILESPYRSTAMNAWRNFQERVKYKVRHLISQQHFEGNDC
jgi:peptidoglycan/xylan/chitin deacetylase (PgdA/CDA1 family)